MARTKQGPPPDAKALDPVPPYTQAIVRHGYEAVAYHIPVAPPSPEQPIVKTAIALPPRSRWTSGLHFHTAHTEYLRLIQGAIFVQLDGELMIISAKAGGQVSYIHSGDVLKPGLLIKVERYARHNWGRASEILSPRNLGRKFAQFTYPGDIEEEVIVEEWTDPADISKALFFWNLNGVITASLGLSLSRRQSIARIVLGSWWIPFQLFIVFWELDNWPVFFNLWHELGMSSMSTSRYGGTVQRVVEYLVTGTILFMASLTGKVFGVQAVVRNRTPHELWKAYIREGVPCRN